MSDSVNHPEHYGGADNPYEAIKVIEAWGLGFHLGNAVKYISRAGKKGGPGSILTDLKKARWYLDRDIQLLEAEYADKQPQSERRADPPRPETSGDAECAHQFCAVSLKSSCLYY